MMLASPLDVGEKLYVCEKPLIIETQIRKHDTYDTLDI